MQEKTITGTKDRDREMGKRYVKGEKKRVRKSRKMR